MAKRAEIFAQIQIAKDCLFSVFYLTFDSPFHCSLDSIFKITKKKDSRREEEEREGKRRGDEVRGREKENRGNRCVGRGGDGKGQQIKC